MKTKTEQAIQFFKAGQLGKAFKIFKSYAGNRKKVYK